MTADGFTKSRSGGPACPPRGRHVGRPLRRGVENSSLRTGLENRPLRRGLESGSRRGGPACPPRAGLLLSIALIALSPLVTPAQGRANFSGTWRMTSADPPVPAGRGRGAGGGGIGGPYAETMLAQAPDTMILTQDATTITAQIGSAKIVYTLDDKTTELPPGDVMAFKSRAHWNGATLHLHYKQGMNWGRDVLTLSGTTLTLVRDLESGGQSTTRALTYARLP